MVLNGPKYNCTNFHTFVKKVNDSFKFWLLASALVIEVPSLVDGKRMYLAQVSDFVSSDEACQVPRHKITYECKIPPLSIQE